LFYRNHTQIHVAVEWVSVKVTLQQGPRRRLCRQTCVWSWFN